MKMLYEDNAKQGVLHNWIPLLILLIYPLRHINWGLDLWDTGYNYANFQYMGLDHMDSMWLYSTYLANVVGNVLTKLPFAGSLVGMNFYTGLFVSALAIAGYWFSIAKLKMPRWIAFVGEMLAISLCWCPTALLYNYLTYVLFLACVILLYIGLSEHKKGCLFAAGVCLGMNVLVRFSNLPEAALILAVWAYALIEGEKILSRLWRNTLWCLGGYLSALAVLLGYIQIRYGLDDYVNGILRLFAMTDNATDYKATSMIMGLVGTYVENLYWVVRICVIVIGGIVFFTLGNRVLDFYHKRHGASGAYAGICNICQKLMKAAWCAVSAAMLVWLYVRGFCSLEFYSYGAILRPGVLFLMLTMGIAAVCILMKGSPREEKLISGLVILVVLLTSIGSNNGVYPSLNNLFVAAPFTLWQCQRFMARAKEWEWTPKFGKRKLGRVVFSAFPVKGILAAFLAMCLFQSIAFGTGFVFVEATGAREVTAKVANNEVLKGVKMHPERAEWMEEISAYVSEQQLTGREVILYGEIPALSYYLQMPSVFNPWSDLRSYSRETMEKAMEEAVHELENGTLKRPVIIVENKYARYWEAGDEAYRADFNALELPLQKEKLRGAYEKWLLIREFMEEYQYRETFTNEKFTIYE